MKQFFKFMFASMLGFFLTFIVISAFFFMMIVGLASLSSKEVTVIQDNSVLYLKLDEQIVERATENPFDNFDFMSFSSEKSSGLNDILQSIKKAKADDKIKGIFLELSTIPAGVASLEEIRNALIDFKSS
ncbi:MAG: signal peptide peptidase SppA, partial [Bacteroidetes bacterium]|nr:signal peptide peptidase SppA [Bacteroidota bacterium]